MIVSVWVVLSSQSLHKVLPMNNVFVLVCVWGRVGRWMWSDTNGEWALTHCWRAWETHVHTCLQKALMVA